MPYVVDANAMNVSQNERISNNAGIAHTAILTIFRSTCLALDEEQKCYQEWINCAGGSFPFALSDWVSDQLVAGKIKLFPSDKSDIRKKLLSFGLPSDDHKWVRLALGCGGKKIITEDIDFFDPTKKKADSVVKEKLKRKGGGPCAKKLNKHFGVTVMCLCHVA